MIPVTVEKVFVFSLCLDRPFIQLTVTGQLGEKRNDRNLKGARHVVSWENFNAVIEGTAVIWIALLLNGFFCRGKTFVKLFNYSVKSTPQQQWPPFRQLGKHKVMMEYLLQCEFFKLETWLLLQTNRNCVRWSQGPCPRRRPCSSWMWSSWPSPCICLAR